MNARPRRSRRRRILAGVGLAVVVATLVSWWLLSVGPTDFAGSDRVALSAYRGGDPTGVPASLRSASIVERGRYLAQAADCAACHTSEGGTAYAGGRAFTLPFGTLYSTNITPDAETGIGKYTDQEFLAAVRRGVRRDGKTLYPAMPFASYATMTDADALAIKAFLGSLAPVHKAPVSNSLHFPVNRRELMTMWAWMFAKDERFTPHAGRSVEWNRGAYLVEALAHCGECHTPRSPFQSLYNRSKFAGTVQAGWRAYNITSDRASGVGEWTDAQLAEYLGKGHSDGRGSAAGPMGEAVELSLQHLTPDDIAAIVTYVRSVPSIASADFPRPRTTAAAELPAADGSHPLGQRVFAQACAGCHEWSGISLLSSRATLIGVRSVNDAGANNVAQVILFGAGRTPSDSGMAMPAFGAALSDIEVAAVANYVTARFGNRGAGLSAGDISTFRQTH